MSIGSLTGCGLLGSPVEEGRPVREVFENTSSVKKIRISNHTMPGTPDRVRPVIYPPKVFAVYVQEHIDQNRQIKIGAHWVYFKLRDSSWFQETIDQEPKVSGDDWNPQELRPILNDKLRKIVIPYKAKGERP